MFAPVGYEPLAKLWSEFSFHNTQALYAEACRFFKTERFIGTAEFGTPEEFGSPLDFVEDIFIETIRSYDLMLCSSAGEVMQTVPYVLGESSDWFTKLSVFESTISAAEDEREPGDRRDWYRTMGSEQFEAWPHRLGRAILWSETYAEPGNDADMPRLLRECRYHTLPMIWERHRFVISLSLPPWTNDPLDEAFFRDTVPKFLGWSFCLSKKQAETWRRKNITGNDFLSFVEHSSIQTRSRGRPRKEETALLYYDLIYPDGNHPTWKVAVGAILERFSFDVSERTLRRALKARDGSNGKDGQSP